MLPQRTESQTEANTDINESDTIPTFPGLPRLIEIEENGNDGAGSEISREDQNESDTSESRVLNWLMSTPQYMDDLNGNGDSRDITPRSDIVNVLYFVKVQIGLKIMLVFRISQSRDQHTG